VTSGPIAEKLGLPAWEEKLPPGTGPDFIGLAASAGVFWFKSFSSFWNILFTSYKSNILRHYSINLTIFIV
jgi:hypothetical protein